MIIALSLIGPLVVLGIYGALYWIFRNDSAIGDR